MPVLDVKKFILNNVLINNVTDKDIEGLLGITENIDFDRNNTHHYNLKFYIRKIDYIMAISDADELYTDEVMDYLFTEFVIGCGLYNVLIQLFNLKWDMNRTGRTGSKEIVFFCSDKFE